MREVLIGRDGLLDAVRGRLDARRTVVLRGDAGTGVSSLLDAVARSAPVVWPFAAGDPPPDALVVIDDAHRLGDSGRRALTALAAGRRVLAGAHADLGWWPGADVVRVGDLDPVAAGRLLARTAGDLDVAERRRIAERAHGNPLALVELPVAWRAAGAAGGWMPPLTDRHATSLLADLTGLPAATRAALDVLAVAGTATVDELVAAATLLGHDAGPDLLGPVPGRAVELRGRSAAFRDPLVRAAWRQRTGPAGRAAVAAARAATTPGPAAGRVVPEAGLTRRELSVARLAADGLTNREIADRLVLSPRTVAAHLYRVFPKLQITTRRALRGRLAELA
jgi:DNA-binding CsgD family transcriptional regulator